MEREAQMVHFLDQSDAWTQDMIDRFGWTLQYVSNGEDEHVPPFCYTIGLHELGHPELLVFGDQCMSAMVLNTVGANRHYHRPDEDSVPAMQLVWPDAHGRFPWDTGYELPAWYQPPPGSFGA
jgi:hypothetical protein